GEDLLAAAQLLVARDGRGVEPLELVEERLEERRERLLLLRALGRLLEDGVRRRLAAAAGEEQRRAAQPDEGGQALVPPRLADQVERAVQHLVQHHLDGARLRAVEHG